MGRVSLPGFRAQAVSEAPAAAVEALAVAVAAAWVDYLAGARFPEVCRGAVCYHGAAAVALPVAVRRRPAGSAVCPAACPASVDPVWIYSGGAGLALED